ncbi:unnamed protein product [Caenorhabditis nigoni]
MSSLYNIARLFLLISIMSTMVVSYAVMPSGEQETRMRVMAKLLANSRSNEFSDDWPPKDFDGSPMKRGLDDDLDQQLSKRTNLKRLVILSARGFGKK